MPATGRGARDCPCCDAHFAPILRGMSDPPQSLYDSEPDEDDLWFIPGPPEDLDPAALPFQLTRPEAEDPRAWEKAEAGLGRDLAGAAAAVARLDEALARLPQALPRLAMAEAAALSWADGDRVTPDRLALYAARRLSAAEPDFRAIARADWARGRLLSKGDPADARAFLGRISDTCDDHEATLLAQEWTRVVGVVDLHPISRAAFGFHLWRRRAAQAPEAVTEPALLAARLGAQGQNMLPFLPLASAGTAALTAGGPVRDRLHAWLYGVIAASQAARLELGRLEAWQARAQAAIRPRTGRTPQALIQALLAAPVLSANSAAQATGASGAAIRRNLALFEEIGLVREITGQSRYRFWRLAL